MLATREVTVGPQGGIFTMSSSGNASTFSPLYGFGSKHPARFIRAAGEPDLYCVADPELPLEQVIDAPLPKPPIEVAVRPHWLFIEGLQLYFAKVAKVVNAATAAAAAAVAGQEAGQGLAAVQAVEGQLRAVLASVATDPAAG
ncbi:TAF domain-containing protein [Haematococcus lacustris]|uniref:TAF domain-containing protein n=1 Tax=Haematococcus lacustris TaxID=44745 RepID=A0A699ZJV5_HAELA|nr:TAF domain-containing protein [Haematococcus lacustris]